VGNWATVDGCGEPKAELYGYEHRPETTVHVAEEIEIICYHFSASVSNQRDERYRETPRRNTKKGQAASGSQFH
jgi:hypothetical protein